MQPEKAAIKKEAFDLLKSFSGAVFAELILLYGHRVGADIPTAASFLYSWIVAHVTIKIF